MSGTEVAHSNRAGTAMRWAGTSALPPLVEEARQGRLETTQPQHLLVAGNSLHVVVEGCPDLGFPWAGSVGGWVLSRHMVLHIPDPYNPDLWGDGPDMVDYEETPLLTALQELEFLGDRLTRSLRDDARNAAYRLELIEEFRHRWETHGIAVASTEKLSTRALRAELAARMMLSEQAMESLMGYARIIVNDLPATLNALKNGQLTERHAKVLADESIGLDAAERARLEEELLPFGETLTVSKFTRKARTTREHIQTRTLNERHATAVAEREIMAIPGRDGMGWLNAHIPGQEMVAIFSRVDKIARSIDDPTRTLQQIRADVYVNLLLDEGAVLPPADGEDGYREPTLHRGVRPDVHVTVPALSLLGKSEVPATLDGFGPISCDVAKQLVGSATGWFRILTHPETGVALSYGRDRYEVPAELKRYLRARDETCRFVGCNRAAYSCDIDHTIAWQDGGETCATNLAHLCKGHHRLKHHTAWKLQHDPDSPGVLEFTSPVGRKYRTEPPGAPPLVQKHWLTDDRSTGDQPPPF
jgi:hypothetical protein